MTSPRGGFALDALNALVADMRDGVGPYLTLFLVGRGGWSPSQIGWALAACGIATLASTPLAGAVYDASKRKRFWLTFGALAIAFATFLLIHAAGFWQVIALQIVTGLASALMGPGIAALSLHLVGARALPNRIGRNETFNHAGNFAAALFAGYLAREHSVIAVFGFVIATSVASAAAALFVPQAKFIENDAPRIRVAPRTFYSLLSDVPLLATLAVAFLFQFANASLVPTVVQALAATSRDDSVRFLSWGLVIAQLVAIPTAWLTGLACRRRSPELCIAFGLFAVALRAMLFASVTRVDALIAAQVLDGIAAGVIAVAPILAAFRVVKDSGRFTFVAGTLASAIGLGASLSNVAAGYVNEAFGPRTSLLAMAVVAGVALAAASARIQPAGGRV